ncbi:hypothetical protein ACFXAS_20775 [Streptomyces sp. NPDC059459]|uniref:hypothetical protein n=1 Tax=Streptomyces sp. NPDC059459 TaxID=3346839 RepID=UPI0036CA1385
MRLRSKALAVTVAGLLALIGSGTADAADGKQRATDSTGPSGSVSWTCTDGSPNAQACFAPLGEWFRIRDTWADGLPVVIQWDFFDDAVGGGMYPAREGTIWNTSGEAAGWLYMNKSFPEDEPGVLRRTLHFRACSGSYPSNAISESTCSEWKVVRT